MKRRVILTVVLSLGIVLPVLGLETGELNWGGSGNNLLKVNEDVARNGSHSLLFDTTIDKNPTSRMVSADIDDEMEGILEGWMLDVPTDTTVWITFGSEMRNCIGVQFGNDATYTLRVGGTNRVNTQVQRIEGWVGFRLEFTGNEVIYYISTDDEESWQEVGESEEFVTFKSLHLRNNQNTGTDKFAAYFDDFRVIDSNGKTVLYEGFGGDVDPLSVSSKYKLASVWGRLKGAGEKKASRLTIDD